MSEKSSAHKHFWIIVILVAACIFGMVYFLSITQEKEDKKSEQLENKLNEQITTTKGIKASVQQITEENEILKNDLELQINENLDLYRKNENLENFAELIVLYINGNNDERIKTLIETIDSTVLNNEQQEILNKIAAEKLEQ